VHARAASSLVLLAAALIASCDSEEFVPVCDEYHAIDLRIDLVGFDDHVGRDLHLRVTSTRNWNPPDPGPYEEIFRADLTIPSGDFTVQQTRGAISCESHHVDLFIDVNGNGAYDPPPTDHAWRLYVFVWEDETRARLTFPYTLDTDACEFDHDGLEGFCDYLDIEWPD